MSERVVNMSEFQRRFTTEVQNCARCGRDHEVIFIRFDNPPPGYTHFGQCPVLAQPILMTLTKE